jgi:Do/DeqQ family serine protease
MTAPIVLHRYWLALIAVLAAGEAFGQIGQPMPTLAPMIERISPAVVNISVSGTVDESLYDDPLLRRFFQLPPDADRNFQSAGSGVIVDAALGHILTNHHVIENAREITVTLFDNRTMKAVVVGTDPASDLAVLKVAADELEAVSFGDSSALHVGDYVVAIGNPFGFSHTVTSGIVSGLGRSGVNPDRDSYEDFIQTDASINPGNSGGALVNLNGELVGINSAILSRTGGNIGIGFAIPVNMARGVMDQLVEFGQVSRGLLGVTITSISPDIADAYDLGDTSGALVTSVGMGSAAEQAGLLINDVIVSVDDKPVRDSGSLRNAIGQHRPGDEVSVGYIRDGRRRSTTAVLSSANVATTTFAPAEPPAAQIDPVFAGAELVPQNKGGVDGLRVASVAPNGAARERGLREGDLITHINREPVASVAEARELVGRARSVILQVQRGDRELLILMR